MRTPLELAIRSLRSFGADSCGIFAGGITYYTLLSLFPLLLFALSIAGFIYQDPAEQRELVQDILDHIPIDAGSGRDNLEQLIGSVVDARGTLGVIGLLGAAYSGSALFSTVRTSLNAVYHADKKRPFWMGKLIDICSVFGFTVLLLLSVAITVGISLLQTFSEEIFGEQASSLFDRLLAVAWALVPTAVSAGIFFLLFTFVPAKKLGARHTIWGAVAAAILFEILKFAFTIYVSNFGNYNATYGTIGFVIILLAFINFSSQVLLLGAEVARASWEMEDDGPQRYRETEALALKVRSLERRIPLMDRFVPGAPPPQSAMEPYLAEEYLAAAPLAAALAAPSYSASTGPTAVALEHRAQRPHRQGAWSSLLLLGAFVTLALGIRRR
jgi:membrane protein